MPDGILGELFLIPTDILKKNKSFSDEIKISINISYLSRNHYSV